MPTYQVIIFIQKLIVQDTLKEFKPWDYYVFLRGIGYASDPLYQKRIKNIVRTMKQ